LKLSSVSSMTSELDGYMATAELARATNKTSAKKPQQRLLITTSRVGRDRQPVCERPSDAGTTYSTAGSCRSAFYPLTTANRKSEEIENKGTEYILDTRAAGVGGRLCRSGARSDDYRTSYGTRKSVGDKEIVPRPCSTPAGRSVRRASFVDVRASD